jgi:polyhydroxybutyrate depolymerase
MGGGADAGTGGGIRDDGGLTADQVVVLQQRPYHLVVPAGYDGGTAVPFVILLHGYTATGATQDAYFHMSELAQARTFLLATPDGLVDTTGQRYWNATDFCCGSAGTQKTDDVAYLTAIMDEVRLNYRVDPKKVFFVGHSNGGFMSHRMACDRAPRVSAIVSLAGAQWLDVSKCQPDAGVPVLQVHGDADLVINYPGTTLYPGAVETVRDWARFDGCDAGSLVSGGADIDLDSLLLGAETKKEQFSGCAPGLSAELWTIRGGSHIPTFNSSWAPSIYEWLLAHARP